MWPRIGIAQIGEKSKRRGGRLAIAWVASLEAGTAEFGILIISVVFGWSIPQLVGFMDDALSLAPGLLGSSQSSCLLSGFCYR